MYKYVNKISGKEKKKNVPKVIAIVISVIGTISSMIIAVVKFKKKK